MGLKRMMVLGAVASTLAFTGCQDRRGGDDTAPGGAGDEAQQPATGGSGTDDSTIPGASNTMGGVRQDEQQPGTELGGTGGSEQLDEQSGVGGSGTKPKAGKKGTMGAGDAGTPGGTDAGTTGGTDAGM